MITRIRIIDDALHDRLQDLGQSFTKISRVPGQKFKLQSFLNIWHKILSMGLGALWSVEHDNKIVGMLGAMIAPDMNDGEIIAQEAFWYVDPSSKRLLDGIRLYKEFSAWASEVGAKRIIMAHLTASMPEKLKHFYLAEGFVAVETTYLKEL